MKEDINEPIIIFCDNISSINISNNYVMHTKTKNIELMYHYLRELVQDKEVRLEYVKTKEQITCTFTKALPKDSFEYLDGTLKDHYFEIL